MQINKQKSIAFLQTSGEQVEFEIRNTASFILALPPPQETLRYKPNKLRERCMGGKLQHSDKGILTPE